MITLLSRLLIPNPQNYQDPNVRSRYGILTGAVGIFLNLFLFALKWIAGVLSGSIAIIADAFNNLSDAGSSVMTLIGFHISAQKPDAEHPFGHGRMEYISGFVVSVAILLMGFELLQSSVNKILHPVLISGTPTTLIILAASVLLKLYMFFYNRSIGSKIESGAIRAAAMDSISDASGTLLVLLSTIISMAFGLKVDGWMGLLVSGFIFYTGIRTMKDMIDPLLGQPPEKELVDEIERIVLSHSLVSGMHDLIVHDYGPDRKMISLHAEVPADGNILEIHEQIDHIETELSKKLHCDALIHMDPIVTDDSYTEELKQKILRIVQSFDPEYSVHDFRVVRKTGYSRLFFDVSVPFHCMTSDSSLIRQIQKKIRDETNGSCYAAITIDHRSYQ